MMLHNRNAQHCDSDGLKQLHRQNIHHPPLTPQSMKGMAWLVTLLFISIPMAGCLEGPEDEEKCEEGLSVSEYLADPDEATIANINTHDIDGDGVDEIISTRPLDGMVTIARCDGRECSEEEISANLTAPVRTHVADMDGDGMNDIVVSDIGILPPADDLVGKVVLFTAVDGGGWLPTTLIEGIGRTVSAESADFDADGDLDLIVCEFGNLEGSIFWLENNNSTWERHPIDNRSGAIHAFPFDVEGDGDIDIAVSLSQVYEEVNIYRNDGSGRFTKRTLVNEDDSYFGMSGIEVVDLDQDGDSDLIFTNGDTLDMDLPEVIEPHSYHGAAWLENDGNGEFIRHELTRVWGAFTTHTIDLEGDGDLDIVLGTLQFSFIFPDLERIDLIILENSGNENFVRHEYREVYRYLITFDSGDIDGDGEVELVGGSHRINFEGPSHRGIEFRWVPSGGCR